MHLKVVTPTRQLVDHDCDVAMLPSARGALEVLPGHAGLIATLGCGVLRYQHEGQWQQLAIKDGFVEIANEHIEVLADIACESSEAKAQNLEQQAKDIEAKLVSADVGVVERAAVLIEQEWLKAKLDLLSH